MAAEYQVVLHGDLLELLFQMRRTERRRLIQFFDTVAKKPGTPGDYEEADSVGRLNQVKVLGRWAITYWADHAVKELRVVRIESA